MSGTLKTYLWRDKNPIIDKVRTKVKDIYGDINAEALKDIEFSGGATRSCTKGWFFGNTQDPKHSNIEATLRSMGLTMDIRPLRKKTRK